MSWFVQCFSYVCFVFTFDAQRGYRPAQEKEQHGSTGTHTARDQGIRSKRLPQSGAEQQWLRRRTARYRKSAAAARVQRPCRAQNTVAVAKRRRTDHEVVADAGKLVFHVQPGAVEVERPEGSESG